MAKLLTKNPFLSAWLSAANAWLGAARGLAAAETRRQQKEMAKAITARPARKKKRRRAN
jgi:hypothetical protein